VVRWPTWLWTVGVWGWVAQAVFQGDAGLAPATARAALGGGVEGLSTAWAPPVPSYRPVAWPALRAAAPDPIAQQKLLSTRGAEWEWLSLPLRLALDEAATLPGGRAPWVRVVVEGTGDHEGGGRDLVFARQRRPVAEPVSSNFLAAHFVIGNGTRSKDGGIERTERPLRDASEVVVSLVGDFSLGEPTPAQLRALTELVDYARAKTGMIPVVLGDSSRAPVAASVLEAAYLPVPIGDPADDPPRK